MAIVIQQGIPDVLRIEAEYETPVDPHWQFGTFVLRAGGQTIGDRTNNATLASVYYAWKEFLDWRGVRWHRALEQLSDDERFDYVHDVIYGDGAEFATGGESAYATFDVSHLAASSFEATIVMLFEPPGRHQCLSWMTASRIVHHHMPPRTMQTVGAAFLAAAPVPAPKVPRASHRAGLAPYVEFDQPNEVRRRSANEEELRS